MNREPRGYSVCESLHLIPSERCCFERVLPHVRNLQGTYGLSPGDSFFPMCWFMLTFLNSLWALIIHAGGVSSPSGQLFWNTVLFSHLAPRNDLCENSRKHQSTVCQRYSISTEIQSSHKHLPHDSLCWQPASAQVAIYEATAPILSSVPV